jgi:hypothetical protein
LKCHFAIFEHVRNNVCPGGTANFDFTVHKMLDILLQLVIEKYRDFCAKILKRASTKIFDWLEK